jgi:chromosome partitioning protein
MPDEVHVIEPDEAAPEQPQEPAARRDEVWSTATDSTPEEVPDEAAEVDEPDEDSTAATDEAAEVDPPAEDDTAVTDDDPIVTPEEESPITQAESATIAQEDDSPIARELADLTARRKALEEAEVQLTGRTRVLTVSNQKGGVGKTTTAVNLAAALAERGARVLVIDLDPQGNASTALGVPHTADTPSVYDVLIDEFPLADIVQVSPESPNLLCAPSTIHLAGAEIELVSQVAREHRLRVAVDEYLANLDERLDFILIDCPPSLGLLTINAFTAATELLIPIQCEYYALEGLSQLLGTVRMIQKHLNPRLQLSTIMLTLYDGRTRLAQQVADEVRAHFPNEVLDTIIPRSVRVSEAPSFGQTVLAYDGQSAGAVAYREAAVEMIRRDSASNEGGA